MTAAAPTTPDDAVSTTDRVRLPHFRALDGIRGVGLVAVLLTHAEVGWAEGGFIGLTAFFTLSGFLITSLLLIERRRSGQIRLDQFWVRRARRLVPAIVIAFVLIAALLPSLDRPPRGLIGDAMASSFWVANWRFVFAHRTYADIFSSPSPFQHFWSLAVEEQFYLLFPPLVVGLIGRARHVPRRRIAAVVGGLIVVSLAISFTVASPSSPYRAYYGTDVRAAEILVGALLAVMLCRRVVQGGSGLPRWASQTIGVTGLALVVGAYFALDEFDPKIFRGGFFLVAVATAMVITSAVDRGTVAERVLSFRPFVFLGTISYGTYLYHWPIFLVLTERSTGLGQLPLLVVRFSLSLGLAVISHRFVEEPIRRNGLPALIGPTAWLNGAVAGIALVALASGEIKPVTPAHASAALGTVVNAGGAPVQVTAPSSTTTLAPATTATGSPAPGSAERSRSAAPGRGEPRAPSTSVHPTTTSPPADREALPEAFYEDPGEAEVPPPPPNAAEKLRIAVIGDSVGVNIGRGLTSWAEERSDVAVLNLALSACPISRGGDRRFSEKYPYPVDPACAWWSDPSSDRYQALRGFAPQVVVIEDGLNEMFDRKLPDWSDWREPADPRLSSWIRAEIGELLKAHAPTPVKVVALNAPCGDWGRYETFDSVTNPDLRIRALNTGVYSRLGSNVVQADLFDRVCPNGSYTNTIEGLSDGRPDGLHFSDEAATALARNWLGPIILDDGTPDTQVTLVP